MWSKLETACDWCNLQNTEIHQPTCPSHTMNAEHASSAPSGHQHIRVMEIARLHTSDDVQKGKMKKERKKKKKGINGGTGRQGRKKGVKGRKVY